MIILEVGKSYEVRNPDYVKSKGHNVVEEIVSELYEYQNYPMIAKSGSSYKINGSFDFEESPYDLVKEV